MLLLLGTGRDGNSNVVVGQLVGWLIGWFVVVAPGGKGSFTVLWFD